MSDPFSSPLRVGPDAGAVAALDFGAIVRTSEVEALAARLQRHIAALAEAMPAPLDTDAHALLAAYPGDARRFIDLFYTPVWSFLHWSLPVPNPAAEQAHALSLFLHLWDDHLSDRQLAPDMLRLHLRSEAWRGFTDAWRSLGDDAHDLAGTYLVAHQRPEAVVDLPGYCRRFVREIGIWRLVPSLLGEISTPVTGIVTDYAVAWRLIDDVQDAAEDVAARHRSALWHALDARGQALWQACEDASAGQAAPEPESWAALQPALLPAARDVVTLARSFLASAERLAGAWGWAGLADEIAAAAAFRGVAALGDL